MKVVGGADQRGLSNSVQFSLLLPVAFTVLLLTLQWALLVWADATALAAAQDAARAAAAINGSASAGQQLGQLAASNGAMAQVEVRVQRGARQTTAIVTGKVHSVIPGVAPTVVKQVDVATERLTGP